MFSVAVTGLVALCLAGPYSRLRFGFFDLFCFAAAFVGALIAPPLLERLAPLFIEIGGVETDAAGALIGCLLYDVYERGWD